MPRQYKRIIIIILDSVGCGVQADYKKFHPHSCNTLKSVYKNNDHFNLPNLERMGLKKILFNREVPPPYCAGTMQAQTAGNDTMAGLWEMMGIIFKKRFRSVTAGLNKRDLKKIEDQLHIPLIGNEYISGIQAINKFYNLHVEKQGPIIYFDKDGVALLAAHTKVISPEKLGKIGEKLATLLLPYGVIRIITRPFVGKLGGFTRKKGKYFAIAGKKMFNHSTLSKLKQHHGQIVATTHIKNLLGGASCIKAIEDKLDNFSLLKKINNLLHKNTKPGIFIFCLREFDMLGHYNNVVGYGQKLKEFDKYLSTINQTLTKKDLLILTADHGCDPTILTRGHSREKVPLIIFNKQNKQKIWLGERKTFADIGQTICQNFQLAPNSIGTAVQELFE
ncbi:MAG: hypothetical protein A2261_00365 [Candidatus Magasanikbacteria bacterium RIFOXYA2_FULL_44_8]|uniref:Metalloenzyme domain-containing protein n=1 Tax=Candidatus Magasanikbacteria bacterium RIFOXYA2_FULL_44_8 TaxID=1798696 RepID=A0A1F6NLT8_9BACT|nr:MAG: hypothetical protein A2261_00365 [Candidatus Magasanikbacteria bacterium RIFOXYA2_FULL_44_8]